MTTPTTTFTTGDLGNAPDPYVLLASVREGGPVLRGPAGWIVLGFAELLAVLRSPAARSGFIANLYRQMLPPGAARDEMGNRINFLDAPDHTRVRKLIAGAFTPRRVEALRPYLDALCRSLLAPLEPDETVDLIGAYAHQVPSLMISELLGVPPEDRGLLTALSDRVAALLGLAGLPPARQKDALDAAEQMHSYLRALLAERRQNPRDDLLSALLVAEEDQQRLSETELLSLAATLYSAGHRTTRDLFANGLSVLLRDSALVGALQDGTLPSSAIVEEFLRFETPTTYVARVLVEPLTVGDVTIPPGEPIMLMLAAANRDPLAYANPDRFDPRRWLADPPPPATLSFAFGPHFCLGAGLARLEASVMLETLFEMRPQLTLGDEALEWRQNGPLRGLAALPVRPGRAAIPR